MTIHQFKTFFRGFIFVLFLGLFFCQSADAQDKTHTIKKGETLSSIAKKYNTTVADLLRLNPGAKKGINAGSVLNLNEAASDKTPVKQEENTADSKSEGKKHQVKPGESLFKIAKKYKVSVQDLERWNGITNKDLRSGAEILVSGPSENLSKEEKNPEPKPVQNREEQQNITIHKVASGETLNRIARFYGMDVKKLKALNGLKTSQVNLGQELKVISMVPKEEKGQPEKISKESFENRPADKVVKEEKPRIQELPKPKDEPQKAPDRPVQGEPTMVEAPKSEEKPIGQEEVKPSSGSIREVNNTLGYTRVVETGFAEAIEGDQSSKKHLCMHKSAPIGSILQVKNEANGQTVFVKVIGRLPETGSNEKLIIRISKVAYDRLLAVGKRFPVEVSYPESQP